MLLCQVECCAGSEVGNDAQHQAGAHVRGELPADDHPAVAVEDEAQVDEVVPGADVGDVGDPFLVRPGRDEVALREVAGPLDRGLVGIVVRCFLPRCTPSRPSWRINRATWSRPTAT
jgi:hypothetical protein